MLNAIGVMAGDYVEAMWLMLQQPEPDDYVISTGITHSVRDFVEAAFNAAEITDWEQYIKADPQYMRPAELNLLQGNSTKAATRLNWQPKVNFEELVSMMVTEDIKRLSELRK